MSIKAIILDFIKSVAYHTPSDVFNNNELNSVRENGLIHFCNSKNKDSILKFGILADQKHPMKRKEKGFTWYYIYEIDSFDEKLQIVHSKGERSSYDAYVIIKNLKEDQINQLRIRRKYDSAVIFPGTLKTDSMKLYMIDKYKE